MRCGACGTENRTDRRFCRECGGSLVAGCATCGAATDPGDRFCGVCGASLTAPSGEPVAAAREGAERRMLSIVFADLVGFTPLSESRDPEEVRELLGQYFEVTRRIVERYGGTLEKFIGDAVVAVWGAPQAQEDDAERAVRTALELVDAVAELGRVSDLPLAVRAGVSTGNAAVTLGAVGQGMVAGDVVNTTARIQMAAEPGTVLVDEATRRATEAAIGYEPPADHELKGKSAPVALSRARRVVAARRGEGRSRGLEPPFVGRSRELSLIKELLHSTAKDGRSHMVAVSGIGGIGKSRLTWELEKYIDGLVDEFLWHRGRCLAYGDGVAFWALAEIVRMRCRILEEEDEQIATDKLDATLAEHLDPDEVELVRAPLRQLLGLESQPVGDRSRLFSGWRLFFERMAATAPVVLVFEDLQWADGALIEFIDYLLEWSRHSPVFVLTLSRPEVAAGRPRSSSAREMTALALDPLTPAEMAELVDGIIPGAPAGLVDRVVDASEGVPLYAVEMVRMLLDRGYVARDGDRLVVAADLQALEIPETLHKLVAARLDALPEPERRLIEDAAVLGKTFTISGLEAVSGVSEVELDPLLASLVRREVLTLQTDPRSPERGQYVFVQAIVRTIAYETLGRRERKRRHLVSARHLESIGGEELAEVIAAHFVDAYRLAPEDDDAAGIRADAVRTLLRAAQRAASLAAPGEAERLTGAAIELSGDDVEQATLIERAGCFALADGRAGDADRLFSTSGELFERLGDAHSAARLNARRAESLFVADRTGDAVTLMEPAYALLRDREQDADLAALAAQYGRMLNFVDRVAEVLEPLELALTISEQLGEWGTLSSALNTKGLWLLTGGRREEGETLLAGSLRVALEHDEHQEALRAYFNLAYAGELRDDRGGNRLDDEGLALARRLGDRHWERAFLLHQMDNTFAYGHWDEAVRLAEQAIEGAHDRFSLGALGYPVATVLAFRGDHEGAAEAMRRSELVRDTQDMQSRVFWAASESGRLMAAERWSEAFEAAAVWMEVEHSLAFDHHALKFASTNWATCALRLGDAASARSFVGRISALTPTERTPFYEAQRRRFTALLGGCDDPSAELSAAADILRRRGLHFQLMLALADAAEFLAEIDPPAAAAALVEARDLVAEMGAVTIGDRLDRFAASSSAGARA